MMFRKISLTLTLICCTIALNAQTISKYVKIDTNKGSFTVGLYDETPLHRDAFIEHVQKGDYNNVIFHRVIRNFMIQAGGNIKGGNEDTRTRMAQAHRETLPAEINYPKLYHKRGAVAAARTANDVNPEKCSNSFQFYVVVGQFYLPKELDEMQEDTGHEIPENIRECYMTEGGTPHLDNEYTVFGEVVKGMEKVLKMQAVETDAADEPVKPLYIKRTTIVTKP